ncbi:MAG: winged helix-turn-helix transcriptional regulator [Paramuribaculum sp.]|nr:winged helix-turn-helix transcriptional regulator [Paramuribaculum sp.]
MSDTQIRILNIIKENPTVTHSVIAKTLLMTTKTAERNTKILRDLGLIRREGSDKKGLWIVCEKN